MGTFIVFALLLDFMVILLILERSQMSKSEKVAWIVITLMIPYIGALIAINVVFLKNRRKKRDSTGGGSSNCSTDDDPFSGFFDGGCNSGGGGSDGGD